MKIERGSELYNAGVKVVARTFEHEGFASALDVVNGIGDLFQLVDHEFNMVQFFKDTQPKGFELAETLEEDVAKRKASLLGGSNAN